MRKFFTGFSAKTAQLVGSYWAFLLAVLVVVIWAATGRMFQYSDTWQLVINTGTTIVTFLMVFLIQNTQNRDAKAMHLKLDELIVAVKQAHNELVDIESLDDEQLEKIAAIYRKKKEECLTDDSSGSIRDEIQRVAATAAQKVAEDTAKGTAEKVAKDVTKEEKNKRVA
ncbi:MAG: low affinity iron permease family protein [Blastocatellia bacterium]